MHDTSRRHAALVGLFVSVGLGILMATVLAVGGLSDALASSVHVAAEFDDVGGLRRGDGVWFSGVPIGTVSDVRFTAGPRVRVDLALDEAHSAFVHGDALAKIGADGLIGNTIVVLYGGSGSAPAVQDGDVLAVGPSVSTDDMLAMLQENNANLLAVTQDLRALAGGLAEGEGSLGKLLTDDQLYADLRATVTALNGASANAKALTASLSAFADQMNAPGSLPHQIVHDRDTYASITATVDQLEGMTADASRIVASLEAGARNPETPLGTLLLDERAGDDLKATLGHLNLGSERLSENLEAMRHHVLFRGAFKKMAREKEEVARSGPDGAGSAPPVTSKAMR